MKPLDWLLKHTRRLLMVIGLLLYPVLAVRQTIRHWHTEDGKHFLLITIVGCNTLFAFVVCSIFYHHYDRLGVLTVLFCSYILGLIGYMFRKTTSLGRQAKDVQVTFKDMPFVA